MSKQSQPSSSFAASPQSGVAPDARGAIADVLRQHIEEQERFCNALETLADQLPDAADPHDCLVAAMTVLPLMRRSHTFEEQELHPVLLRDASNSTDLAGTLERLRFEHMGDEVFAEDLCHALRQFATDRKSCNVESLAWMLRGFFEGLRRHLAFERDYLLPRLADGRATL